MTSHYCDVKNINYYSDLIKWLFTIFALLDNYSGLIECLLSALILLNDCWFLNLLLNDYSQLCPYQRNKYYSGLNN